MVLIELWLGIGPVLCRAASVVTAGICVEFMGGNAIVASAPIQAGIEFKAKTDVCWNCPRTCEGFHFRASW